MEITINDDFHLKKIALSGQCFRVGELPDNYFRFINGAHVLYIKKTSSIKYEINCSISEWNTTWSPYFDLQRNYHLIRQSIPDDDVYMKNAAKEGMGIRILRQDPWEMLITFIISQRKSIPAIRTSVELLSKSFGSPIQTERESLFLFPTPEQLKHASNLELQNCKLGYRVPYIQDAVNLVINKKINLEILRHYDDKTLFNSIKTIRGVGDKISNCICLFAFGRLSMIPIDTWIQKIVNSKYGGENPFPKYGDIAGIIQQYAFYYAQNHKNEF